MFDVAFGETDRCKVCSIGIEPNPTHFEWHGKLQGALRGAGAGVLVISGAAGSNTGVSEFYFSGSSKSDDLEVGASTTAAHGVKNGNMLLEHVQIVDVPKLIHILHAHLVLRGAGKRKGVILAKSDIEGSEYSLLPSLVLTQTFCLIDYIFTEWHGKKYSRDVLDIVASEKQVQRDRSGSARFQKYISRVRDFFKAPFNIFSTRLSTTLLVRRACLKWMTKHMSPMACLCQRPQCANRRNITASGRALLSCRLVRGKKIQLVPGCLTCTRNTFYFGRHSSEPYNFGYRAKALQLFHCIADHKCPYIY